MKRALLLFALVACSGKSSSPEAPPPLRPEPTEGSGSAAGSSTAPVAEGGPGMGEKCGENDACAKGFECVSYYGIAGPRGPQFKSCEIRCEMQNKESVCPQGTKCVTVADGPGQVCR